ncbi:MAG: methylmalonyl Co-A mutase-associated GTPase MeaB [Spirochaetales bacterium]|nr:methylmalonyl Co-A mutase-associated GTPase MeaB [Spirochaetales bacterium]MBP7263052.1 methylmalonyl Co-A mutase-associated GTPase MeaB [Spirochaetia bacterium]
MSDALSLADRARTGDVRARARLITLIERDDPERLGALSALRASARGSAHVVGITGPPGAGKSTLTDKIVSELRSRGRTVAVVAIDPSSPFTGGALLGDRIRMNRHATDEGVFIRSLATRGHLGGLSRATGETVRLLDALGYDDVIIETVGVGQSEVDIVRLADTVVLVSVPGLGDDIQAIKAGVMEIGDVFCVNKADRDGAERVVREIRSMLETAVMNGAATRFSELFAALADRKQAAREPENADARAHFSQGAAHHIAADGHGSLELPPVVATVAETGQGVRELVDHIKAHEAGLEATGLLAKQRRANLAWELGTEAAGRLVGLLEHEERREEVAALADAVLARCMDFHDAVAGVERSLAEAIRSKGS